MSTPVVGLETKIWFGKYKMHTIEQMINNKVSYLRWCVKKKIFKLDSEALPIYAKSLNRVQNSVVGYKNLNNFYNK